MDQLEKAKIYHDEAEGMKALAMLQDHEMKRKVMLNISELYFLLGDKLIELTEPFPSGEIVKFARGWRPSKY
jgi:hypothetical protein